MFLAFLASLVLLGSPGAGKGTFANEYVRLHPDAVHFSVGDWIREEIKQKTPLGERIQEEMAKDSFAQNGYLLDNEFIQEIVNEKIKEFMSEGKDFILDGFPRNIDQIKFIEHLDLDYVYLKIDPATAKERMVKRGRENEETILNRLAGFERVTLPGILYLHDKGVLIELDASLSPQEIVDAYEKIL